MGGPIAIAVASVVILIVLLLAGLRFGNQNDAVGVSFMSPEIKSVPLLLKALLHYARVIDSEPERAIKSLVRLKESVSEHGDTTERVAFHFTKALYRRVSPPPEKSTAACNAACEEDFTLSYKA